MWGPVLERGQLAVGARALVPALARFGVRGWLATAGVTVVVALVTGIPTVLIPNSLFGRMTPTHPRDYLVWVLSSLLAGVIAGTYAAQPVEGSERRALAGGLLTYLAIGCPTCNKLVVLLIGTSGALNFFGPVQVLLGVASVVLLAWAVLVRAAAISTGACPLPAPLERR